MKLSARNSLLLTISNIKEGAVNNEICAEFDGKKLVAMITKQSCQMLNLQTGKKAYFIFKAPNVIVAKDEKLQISVQNQLRVTIKQIKTGAVNSQIIANFGEQELCAVITNESCKNLDLKENQSVLFLISPNDIIIAVE